MLIFRLENGNCSFSNEVKKMERLELYSKKRNTLYLDFLLRGPEQRPTGQQALALECCLWGKKTVAAHERRWEQRFTADWFGLPLANLWPLNCLGLFIGGGQYLGYLF